MNNETAFTTKPTLLLFQQQLGLKDNLAMPFAYTDLLIRQTDTYGQPMIHFWEAEKMVILGMQDTRVTDLKAGLARLHEAGYPFIVRNSGGLGVVSDEGILNFSLFLPFSESEPISITKGYELMTLVIQTAFNDFDVKIEPGEVSDSYCPGEFDLSIAGQKFAGIAQRRIRNGMVVMIYISVNGNQLARGELMRNFYQASLGEDFGKKNFPPVRPAAMANLSDLLNYELTVEETKDLITTSFTNELGKKIVPTAFDPYIAENDLAKDFAHHLERMDRRNETIKEIGVELDGRSL